MTRLEVIKFPGKIFRGETMIKNITVKSVRYYETSRGVGYEAKTNEGSIWNDGNGGATYFQADYPKYHNQDFSHLTEWDLESIIDKYEEKERKQNG